MLSKYSCHVFASWLIIFKLVGHVGTSMDNTSMKLNMPPLRISENCCYFLTVQPTVINFSVIVETFIQNTSMHRYCVSKWFYMWHSPCWSLKNRCHSKDLHQMLLCWHCIKLFVFIQRPIFASGHPGLRLVLGWEYWALWTWIVCRCELIFVTDRLYSWYRADTDVKWIKQHDGIILVHLNSRKKTH